MMPVFEVMDKEPSLRAIWGAATFLGLVGFAAARLRRWLVIPALALIAIMAWSQLGELADPTVGPAIIQEAGRRYLVPAAAAGAPGGVPSVVGVGSDTGGGLRTADTCG